MCRMLGVISSKRVDATWVRQFKEQAKTGITVKQDGSGHQDGWGIVYYEGGKPLYLGREPTSPFADQKYDIAVNAINSGAAPSSIIIAHLRRASEGSAKTLTNTHPFTYKNWAFEHNGTIYDFKPALQLPMEGDTDSETFFKYILPACLKASDKSAGNCLLDSIRDAKRLLKKYRAMNFIMTDGESLYAYRDFNESEVHGRYYTLKYCIAGDTVAVSSEPLTAHVPEKEWEDIKNGQLLMVGSDLVPRFAQV